MNEIVNPRTGQRMTFLNESPDVLEIDTVNPPTSLPEPEHVHPAQESGCRVTSGVLRFQVAGVERTVQAGESITIPANTPHFFWNDGSEDAHAVQWFRPALKTRAFFETFFALARDGKLDANGMPGTLQIAAMIPVFADEIRPTRPPWPLQRAVGAVLGPIARRRGYRGMYAAAGGSSARAL
jgi:mannose-6-phosphate isomerase-like protein (cupin superfamily)